MTCQAQSRRSRLSSIVIPAAHTVNHPGLDLSLLVPLDYGHMFFALDAELGRALEQLPKTRDRLENAVKFAWFSACKDPQIPHSGVEDAGRLREGFLRAALAELVSAEEVLSLDLGERVAIGVTKMNSLPHPLLHVVRELRNHELHLRQTPLAAFTRERMWGHIDRPADATVLSLTLWQLEGVSVESFSALRNAKRYSRSQVEAMIGWFNAQQSEWGVQELVLRAVRIYAEALRQRYIAD